MYYVEIRVSCHSMRESEFVKGLYKVDLGLTILFWNVYGGDEFYPLRENATLSDFKMHFSKLIITIKQAFISTCSTTDKAHMDEIILLTKEELDSIRKIKTIEELFTSLIIFFPKLCFLIIGKMPNNNFKRMKDNRATWKINQHRQLHYTQTREQQLHLLRDHLKNENVTGLTSYNEELKNYQSQRIKGEDMLSWFKRLHPEKYFNLFDKTN